MRKYIFSVFFLCIFASWSEASIKPQKVWTVLPRKTMHYASEGLFIGGSSQVQSIVVLDVRFSKHRKTERIVLDLESGHAKPLILETPPYYQVAIDSRRNRLSVSLWGHPLLSFSPKRALRRFRNSRFVKEAYFFPHFEKKLWTFVLEMKRPFEVEVFELRKPVRIVLDIRKH